jgi:hypothetical protein
VLNLNNGRGMTVDNIGGRLPGGQTVRFCSFRSILKNGIGWEDRMTLLSVKAAVGHQWLFGIVEKLEVVMKVFPDRFMRFLTPRGPYTDKKRIPTRVECGEVIMACRKR